jgi:excisionase family DNA binding protein
MEHQRHLRVEEFAQRTGYKIPTIRKKLLRREITYRKVGRIVLIPESEVDRLLGDLRLAIPSRLPPTP